MRKKLLLKIFACSVLLPVIAGVTLIVETKAVALGDNAAVIATVDGMDIKTTTVGEKSYLFLPASADLDCLKLRFESLEYDSSVLWRGEKGRAKATEFINVNAIAQKDDSSCYAVEVVTKEGASFTFNVMQGAGIRTLYLYSNDARLGRTWVDSSKKNQVTGSMELVTAEGDVIYEGALTQIKARGNSTFKHYPKKAYQIKLEKKADLLGIGEKGKTWVLLANYGDATMLHDKFFKDFSAELGMDYAVSSDWVNLYYDGEYRGVYLLGEKVSVGETNVDITDMEEAYEEINPYYGDDMDVSTALNNYGQKYLYTKNIIEPDVITGGYLIEKNHDYIDEANGFFTKRGVAFNVKSPEWAGREAMEYISEYYQAFEDAVYAVDAEGNYTGYNTETGKYYYEYCDLESLVKVFLLQELALNPDGFYSSLFFYKDVDGIMYAGPIWDQDMSLGTGWTKYISTSIIDYHHMAKALIQIPHFKAALDEYFAYYFLPRVEALLEEGALIDAQIELLADNAAMNYVLWPYVRVGHPEDENHLWGEGTDYATVTTDMKGWIGRRLNVMRKTFAVSETIKYFDDVHYSDWEYEAVCYATANGILNGVTDEQFDPDRTATRGMLLTVLARLSGQDTTPDTEERYYQPGVDWAVANGISDGSNPDNAITRQQLATMLWRYMGEPESDGNLAEFKDSAQVSAYAVEAMEWAVANGIFQGNSAKLLNPTGTATRAHIAQVFMNFLK